MHFRVAPLKGSFMIISIVGLVLSFYIYGSFPSYAFAFMIVFVLMFVASLISMTYAPVESYTFPEEKKGRNQGKRSL